MCPPQSCFLAFWISTDAALTSEHVVADSTPYFATSAILKIPSNSLMITVEAVVQDENVWVWRSVLSVLCPFSELIWKSLEHCAMWLVASSD